MRLLSGVLNDGHTHRPHRRQHNVNGGSHTDRIQIDGITHQLIGTDLNAIVLQRSDLGAQRTEPLEVQINGTLAEPAAARHRHPGTAVFAQQSTDEIIGGPHIPRQIVVDLAGGDTGGVDLYGIIVDAGNRRTQGLQQSQRDDHILDIGNILYAAGLVRQQGSGQNGHHGIFGTANIHGTGQRNAAVEPPAVTVSGILDFFCRMIVRGPGINTSARR